MQNVALEYEKIMRSFSRFENGDVSVSMERMGLGYIKNYGVSIPDIDKMASLIKANNELALYLLKQDERESKLLGIRLFIHSSSIHHYIENVLDCIQNIELAEQAAMHFFAKLAGFEQIAQKLIFHNNEFCRLAGYLALSKFARKPNKVLNNFFEELLINLGKSNEKSGAVYIKRAISSMLLAIANRSESLKLRVIDWIERSNFNNSEYKDWFKQEVSYYLLIKN